MKLKDRFSLKDKFPLKDQSDLTWESIAVNRKLARQERLKNKWKAVSIIIAIVALLIVGLSTYIAYNSGYGNGHSTGWETGHNDGKEEFWDKYGEEYEFYHKYAVIVASAGGTSTEGAKYHRYGCHHIQDSSFFIYNIDNAQAMGYEPCADCYGE